MNNRLSISPLIEENMNQMTDGEFSISQITGHVTIKKEKEYISKTKEINTSLIDISSFSDDIGNKVAQDEKNYQSLNTKELEENQNKIKAIIDSIEKDLPVYEEKCESLSKELDSMEEKFIGLLQKGQTKYNLAINSNNDNLGTLLVLLETIEKINDCQTYFSNYVQNTWKYYDTTSKTIKDYGTISKNNENINEMNKRVNIDTYNSMKASIENRYKNSSAPWNLKTLQGVNKNGRTTYTITGGY